MTATNLSATGRDIGVVRWRWWILAVVGVAQLMVVLDATIVNIALPSAQRALHFSDGNRQWVVTAYALAFGSLLLLGGRLADMFGRKAVFLVGLVGFGVVSALGGAAPDFGLLITARALQGFFGALLAPSALALLATTFTEGKDRARAFGIFGAIAGSGGAVGLLLGGTLTEYLSWRWTLYVNLAFAIAAAVGGAVLLPRATRDRTVRLDIPGAALVSAGVFAVVYGFASAVTHGWSAAQTGGLLVGGVVLLAAFGVWQTRAAHPLLPLRVLTERTRAASYFSVAIIGAAMFGMFLFLTYYMQQNLHFSPVRTGIAFLPMIAAMMVTSALSTSVLLPRIGPKPTIPASMIVAASGMFWLTSLDLSSSYTSGVLLPVLVIGFGIGGVISPAMSLATHEVSEHDTGVASATVNTMMQLGGSVGTALLNSLATNAATSYLHGKNAGAPAVLARAALHSYSTAYSWSGVFFVIGCLVTALLYKRDRIVTDGLPAVHT